MTFQILTEALAAIFTLQNLLFMVVAILFGIMAGALPGFSATMAVALLVPFTFTMSPVSGLITIGALYASTIFGGSFSAILLNTPGTPSSIGTCFDGFPMAKKGKGQEAVYIATVGSGLGGIIGTFGLILFAVPLARAALKFGPPEYFWVAIFGLTIISSISEESLLKGLAAGLIGILVSMIGIAPVGGDMRFDFGLVSLQGGVEIVSVLIGFFCVPEIFKMAMDPKSGYSQVNSAEHEKGSLKRAFGHVFGHPLASLRASVIGLLVGILPGAGGNIANLIAYNEAKRASKHPETFGTGEPQGVVATEVSNNAVVEGAMVPLLALGIPGSPPAAIIYGALLLQGLSPGPQLFTANASLVYAFMISFLVVNVLMTVIGLVAGRGMYKGIIKVPVRVLIPSILFLTVLGSYAIRSNPMDVVIMFLSGIIGWILKDLGFNTGAFVLGLILGPIAEKGFVQGLLMGNMVSMTSPWIIFFTRSLSLVLIAISVFSAAWPFIRSIGRKKKPSAVQAALRNNAMEEKKLNTDYIGGAIVLAVSALFFFQIGPWSKFAIMAPRSILWIIFAFGAALLVKGKVKPEMLASSFPKINRSMIFIVVMGLIWVFAFNVVGFLVTSSVAFFVILFVYSPKSGKERIIESAAVTAGVVAVLYLLFNKFLLVMLPTGFLI
jgi:putative tricarboxylic transport membrane protein